MHGKSFYTFAVLSLFASLTTSSWAEDTPLTSLGARAGEHPDFDRIVFDWPHPTTYHIQREGSHISVHFEAGAKVQFNGFSYLTRAHDFKTELDQNKNLTVSFIVAPEASLKDFMSGNSVVIDIQTLTGPSAKTASNEKPERSTSSISSTSPTSSTARTPTIQTSASSSETTTPSSTLPANAAPIPISTTTATTSTPSKLSLPVSEDSLSNLKISEPKTSDNHLVTPFTPDAAPPLRSTPKSTADSSGTLISIPSLNSTSPPLATSQPDLSSYSPQTTEADLGFELGNTPVLVAQLDPHTPLRAVIWHRGDQGYIVFDRKLSLSINDLTPSGQPPRIPLNALDLDKTSGFRFSVPSTVGVQATREGTVWKIYLTSQEPDIPVSSLLVAQPDFALGARFLLPLPDAPNPLRFNDPIVGDTLVLIPLEQNQAFSVARHMADFNILPAAQGLVIKPLTDTVVARAVSDGVEISAEGGLRLSPDTDTGAVRQSGNMAKTVAAGKSLFDFAIWQGKPYETFTQTRQRLQQTIVDVSERERNRARLELARFYFSHGNGTEAEALLEWLAQQIPDLNNHADFLALSGASLILANHPEEGLQKLNSPLLSNQPEIELWQAVGAAELRDWPTAEEKFASTQTLLSGYPEPFYSRFYVLAIEAAAATDKEHEASDWLDYFENSPHDPRVEPAINYLQGVLHAKAGRAAAAEAAWKTAVASNDQLYKIRAELALVDLGVATGSLTAAQAADRLEALRFGWRGDDLEIDILHRLGEFYIQAHNVKAGLTTLAQIIQLYPDNSLTSKIREEMTQIFHDVFLGDLGKKLSPLDALTLYQQYHNLTPNGNDGIAVIRNLAERLVSIDLLTQAGDLLEDLVKNRLSGDDKIRVSTRLAAVRLLDHKPEQALTALDYANSLTISTEQQNERLLLKARAFSELGKNDEALDLLQNNTREPAKLLRADITMRAQKWPDAAKALLDLIGPPPKPGELLRNEQADWLVNCAIALAMAGDQTGLDKLAIDYGTAMIGLPQNDTFRVLTEPQKTGQFKDLSAVQSRITDADMFQGFLNSYRQVDNLNSAGTANAKSP